MPNSPRKLLDVGNVSNSWAHFANSLTICFGVSENSLVCLFIFKLFEFYFRECTSHTKLVVSEWYARVSLPMRSIECSRCLREVLYTYILGFLTNNGMPPANIFDILVRSALTAHVRRGSDNAFSTRLYGKYFAEE